MSETARPERNRGGRPRVDAVPVTLRLRPLLLNALDDFRRQQRDLPTRPEAVRRIVAQILRGKNYLK